MFTVVPNCARPFVGIGLKNYHFIYLYVISIGKEVNFDNSGHAFIRWHAPHKDGSHERLLLWDVQLLSWLGSVTRTSRFFTSRVQYNRSDWQKTTGIKTQKKTKTQKTIPKLVMKNGCQYMCFHYMGHWLGFMYTLQLPNFHSEIPLLKPKYQSRATFIIDNYILTTVTTSLYWNSSVFYVFVYLCGKVTWPHVLMPSW